MLKVLTCFSFFIFANAFSFEKNESLIFQVPYPPKSLHPINVEGYDAGFAHKYVFESLLRRDKDTYKWTPCLAAKFEVNPKKGTYTFWIRKNASWSDGKPITATDVKFSFDALFDSRFKAVHLSPYYENISKVQILNDKKVRFHLKNNYFKNFSSAAQMLIIPKHIYGKKNSNIDLNKNMIGSGPYKLKSWERGKFLHLVVNKIWWGRKDSQATNTRLSKNIVFRFIGNTFSALELLKTGALDYVKLELNSYQRISKLEPKRKIIARKVKNASPKAVPYLGFNLKKGPFAKHDIRKALSLLLDRSAISHKVYKGQYSCAHGPWYNESPFSPKDAPRKDLRPGKGLFHSKE